MSLQSKPYYWVVCDCCGEKADYGDYSAWSDEGQAIEFMDDADFKRIDDEDLCPLCWSWTYDDSDEGADFVRAHATHPEKSA